MSKFDHVLRGVGRAFIFNETTAPTSGVPSTIEGGGERERKGRCNGIEERRGSGGANI